MKPVDRCCTPDSDHNLVAAKLIVLLETNLRFPGRVTSKENSVLLWKIFVLKIGSKLMVVEESGVGVEWWNPTI